MHYKGRSSLDNPGEMKQGPKELDNILTLNGETEERVKIL